MEKWNKKLLLEDGSQFYGYGFGSQEEKITEIVFNTAPVGYQEILSDPSYTYQTVVMAYPLIGNYGIAKEDFETKQPSIGGLAVRDYNDIPSNFRSAATLDEVMNIQRQSAEKRRAAAAELGRIEGELKQKLLELRG